MERIGLAGLTLHDTDVEGLEGLRRALDASPARCARELADELAASELVLIATCNRVELVYARESGHRPGPADRARLIGGLETLGALVSGPRARAERSASMPGAPGASSNGAANRLWIRAGRDAVHHLLRVACSLDSLVVGEAQIQGQVREAFERARTMGLVGDALSPVFEAALQVGKQVRSETELARHPVSVVSLGVQHLADRLAAHRGGGQRPRIALLGAGHMGELAAHSLEDHGLVVALVANRTLARAEALATRYGARAMELAAFQRELPAVDGVVSATGAPEVVLDAAALAELARRAGAAPGGKPFVAVDLAVPMDLEPCPDGTGLEVVGLDRLRALAEHNRRQREEAARAAEELVERKLAALETKAMNRRISDVVARTLEETTDLFEHELERALVGKLAHLDERARRTVERWARSTFGRLAHAPMRAIKELAADLARPGNALEDPLAEEPREHGRAQGH